MISSPHPFEVSRKQENLNLEVKSMSKVAPLPPPTSTAIPDAACQLQHTPISLQTLEVKLEEDLHPWVKVDQAEGLCRRNHLTFW